MFLQAQSEKLDHFFHTRVASVPGLLLFQCGDGLVHINALICILVQNVPWLLLGITKKMFNMDSNLGAAPLEWDLSSLLPFCH